jgi:hypothetical protein
MLALISVSADMFSEQYVDSTLLLNNAFKNKNHHYRHFFTLTDLNYFYAS